jgi:hypothetical protein
MKNEVNKNNEGKTNKDKKMEKETQDLEKSSKIRRGAIK